MGKARRKSQKGLRRLPAKRHQGSAATIEPAGDPISEESRRLSFAIKAELGSTTPPGERLPQKVTFKTFHYICAKLFGVERAPGVFYWRKKLYIAEAYDIDAAPMRKVINVNPSFINFTTGEIQ